MDEKFANLTGECDICESRFSLEDFFVYYKSIKREVKRRLMYEYRCDERLKAKNEEATNWVEILFIMNR